VKKKSSDAKLTVEQLRANIIRLRQVKLQIKQLKAEEAKLVAPIVESLGIRGKTCFEIAEGALLTATVVQSFRRSVDWRKTAVALAKKLYPTAEAMRQWARSIVRKHPKKPCKPYVLVTVGDEKEEDAAA
jgi:hypothetical protein